MLQSDLYSLGIVLLELAETFHTDMERVETITELRKGKLPAHLTAQEPQIAQIISRLIIKKPNLRPCAQEILEQINHSADNELVNELRTKLIEKDNEIARLKDLLKKAGVDV